MTPEEFKATTPRVVYRDAAYGRPAYQTIRLADLRWVPKHVETSHRLGDPTPIKRDRADCVRVMTPGRMRDVVPASLEQYVRKPTSRALARIEAAEAALLAAKADLKAARRAAFTYGKPVALSAIKRTTVERERVQKENQ